LDDTSRRVNSKGQNVLRSEKYPGGKKREQLRHLWPAKMEEPLFLFVISGFNRAKAAFIQFLAKLFRKMTSAVTVSRFA